GYVGAATIAEMESKGRFVRITSAGLKESHHGTPVWRRRSVCRLTVGSGDRRHPDPRFRQ
ncbi:hypothetical protein, partial [Streptomyces sp. NPDC058045]|uniref:hypothetical protein n=1 Tax=Streptomyces sp. NPDC058045 TaxID=3346311 RepID=UPI0036EF0284